MLTAPSQSNTCGRASNLSATAAKAFEEVLLIVLENIPLKSAPISAGSDHILALRRDGSVLSWGYGAQGQLGRIGSRHRAPEKTQLTPGLVPLHRVKGQPNSTPNKSLTMLLAYLLA